MIRSFEKLSPSSFDYEKYEALRKKILSREKIFGKIFLVIIILWVVACLILFFVDFLSGFLLSLLGIPFLIALRMLITYKNLSVPTLEVSKDLLKRIDKNFSAGKKIKNLKKEFLRLGFIGNRFGINTYFTVGGIVNGNEFSLAEMSVNKNISRYGTRFRNFFKGVFFIIKTDKQFEFTSVFSKFTHKRTENLIKYAKSVIIKPLGRKKISIGNKDFEQNYQVLTKDENFAKTVLKQEFIDYLNLLSKKFDVLTTLRNNKIYIGIFSDRLYFYLNVNKKITESSIKKIYDNFKLFYEIVENVTAYISDNYNHKNF